MSTQMIELVVGETPLRVIADYSPGRPGVHTLPNGDPGYPDDPDEFWIETVEAKINGFWADVTDLLQACGVDLEDFDSALVSAVYDRMCEQHAEQELPEEPEKPGWWETRLP